MAYKIEYSKNQLINGVSFLKEVEPHIKPNGKTKRMAIFKCQCGKEFINSFENIKKVSYPSCGCKWNKIRGSHRESKQDYIEFMRV